MSIPKRFYQLQDLILLRTSLKKVKLHLDERKEKSVYKWINSELTEFLRKYEKVGCKQQGEEIGRGIESENWVAIRTNVEQCLKILDQEIEKIYREMADVGTNV